MDNKALFTGFSEEEEKRYTEEVRQRYGSQYVDESVKRWGSYSKEMKQQILEEGRDIYLDMIQAMPAGPDSPAAQACVIRWHQNLRHFYEPTPEILLGLGDLYNEDPRFNATFNSFHPELAAFMREAIRFYHTSITVS